MSSFSCLSNQIGIRGFCTDTTPVSELFVNDLPGINLKMIASLASEEQESFSGVWDEIRRRGIAILESDILTHMQKFIRTNILLSNQLSGKYTTDFEDHTEASADFFRGTFIELCWSKDSEIYINTLEVFFDTAHSGVITIYDANTGFVLDTIAYTGIVGFNTIRIDKEYAIAGQRKKLFIVYDGNLSGTQESKISTCFCGDQGVAQIKGGQINKVLSVREDNITFDGNTHGMVVNFNIQCSVSQFVCSMRELLKFALWNKIGEEMMWERITSDKINFYTLVNQERAKELQELYHDRYLENMDSVLNNLEPEGDGICFPCRKRRMQMVSIP